MSDEDDQATSNVIDWIDFFQRDFIRINPSDLITDVQINEDLSCSFTVNGRLVEVKKVISFWYRRGHLNLVTHQMQSADFIFKSNINNHLKAENNALQKFILNSLVKRNGLGDYYNSDSNKLDILSKAVEVGLRIPETFVTTKKDELQNFFNKHGAIISKCSSDVIMSTKESISLVSYTKRITQNEIDNLSETFSSSLFQKEISKKFELRIFFIDKVFYPMAIFSQLDSQTEVDFRVYNRIRPNRNVPYRLPIKIEAKLIDLICQCNYNTGSIDMIVNKEHEYIFLEINPIGQYDMVSFPCNYYLHKKIAERLCF